MENSQKDLTVTEILDQVKDEFCNDYCRYTKECTEQFEKEGDTRPCPLDRL